MIDNKLVFFKTEEAFKLELGSGKISPESLVFIKDVRKIYTHGVYFNANGGEYDEYIKWFDADSTNDSEDTESIPPEIKLVCLRRDDYNSLVDSKLINNNTYYFTYES